MSHPHKIILKNGLRILLVPQPAALTATVLILVEAGSEYETKNQNGISHFLEHMVFKGTTNRPRPGMIAAELDGLGSEYNAFTGQEYTGYWAKAEARKLPHILELVSDLYLNPLFNQAEIEKERGVVIEEINMYEDTPMRRVQELFSSLLYGDQPAGWDVGGQKDVIRKLHKEDFVKYREKRYIAPSTAVVVAGNFKESEVLSTVKHSFGHLPRKSKAPKPGFSEKQNKPAIMAKFKKSDQTHLVLGVRAFDIFDRRRDALTVLMHVLGGGMSSRLFRRIREELGAAYYVRADADLFLDHGFCAISVGAHVAKVKEVVAAVMEELRRLRQEPVGREELKRAKDHLTGTFMLGLESSDELASFYGGQEILKHSFAGPEVICRRIDAVNSSEIQKLAKELFVERHLNLAAIGPHKNGKEFKKLLKI